MIEWHPAFDSGDVAWVLLTAVAVLVLLGPGLTLFYVGFLGRGRLPEFAPRCVAAVILLSLVWALWGFSLGFAPGWGTVPEGSLDSAVATDMQSMMEAAHNIEVTWEQQGRGGWIGGGDYVALRGIAPRAGVPRPLFPARRAAEHVPHAGFMLLHMMVFVSAAAPLAVIVADRLPWTATMLFLTLWGTVVYAPLVHWIWGEGWLSELGALDSSGGLWHVGVGCSAGVCALLLRPKPRNDGCEAPDQKSVLTLMAGTILVWAAMLAMNGGLALRADGRAAISVLNSHLAAGAGAIGWYLAARLVRGPAGMPTWCAGAVAGLAAIAPGCSLMVPESSLIVGLTAGAAAAVTWYALRGRDAGRDAAAPFAVQGVAGGLGTILAGVFTTSGVAGLDRHGQAIEGLVAGNPARIEMQALAVGAAAALAVIGTGLILAFIRLGVRSRPLNQTENDLSENGSANEPG